MSVSAMSASVMSSGDVGVGDVGVGDVGVGDVGVGDVGVGVEVPKRSRAAQNALSRPEPSGIWANPATTSLPSVVRARAFASPEPAGS